MDTKAYVSTLHSRGSFHWTENSEESENYAAFCEVNLLPCRVVSVACTVLFLPDYLPKISSLISYLLKLTLTTTTITRAALHMYNGTKNKFSSHSYFKVTIFSIIDRMETILEYT